MYVRLAFSVAAHLDTDILVVDEVLAVGDQTFQKKCLSKMGDVGRSGKTVLFVSHNMGAVNSLCSRCVVLGEGKLLLVGSTADALGRYLNDSAVSAGALSVREFSGPLKGEVIFDVLRLNGINIGQTTMVDPAEELLFEVSGRSERDFDNFEFQLSVFSNGLQIVTVHDAVVGTPLRAGDFHSTFRIPAKSLRPGEYRFGVGGLRKGGGQWLWGADLGSFVIIERWASDYRESSPGLFNCESVGARSQ
jgi:lipopolysaccharide transport system ATP-binding protein